MISDYYSVTVAYNPGILLKNQIEYLIAKEIKPIVVFNSNYSGQLEGLANVIVIENIYNLGLAKAINIGMRKAIELGAKGVFLFDQDSLPEGNFINEMISFFNSKNDSLQNLACVAPMIYNVSNDTNWPIPVRNNGKLTFINTLKDENSEVDYAITSGLFISKESWIAVGEYLDSFFIDGLDIEWGYRANSKGYKSIINRDIKLHHNLGDKAISILPFINKKMIIHSPLRRFYMFRNFFWMCKLDYIPKDFKWHYFKKLIKMFIAILISPIQWLSIYYILKGTFIGIFSKPNAFEKAL